MLNVMHVICKEKMNTLIDWETPYGFERIEPLLLYFAVRHNDEQAWRILDTKHTFDFIYQLKARTNAALKQGISLHELSIPKKVDEWPDIASDIQTGAEEPIKGKVLVIQRVNENSSGLDLPGDFPATRYTVSRDDLDVVILITHVSRHTEDYTSNIKGNQFVTNVYAINAKTGLAYADYGPYLGGELPQWITVKQGTKDYYGSRNERSAQDAVRQILNKLK